MGGLVRAIGGLFGMGGGDDGAAAAEQARKEAEAKQQQLEQQRAANQAQLEAINRNAAKDLTQENRAQIVAGGSADIVGQAQDDARRRRIAGGLSSALGINV